MAEKPDYRRLRLVVKEAARQAFEEVRQLHPDESFYAFALHTSGDASYAAPSANSEEGLKHKLAEYAQQDHAADEQSLRWNTCDWVYHNRGESHFTQAQEVIDNAINDGELNGATWERRKTRLFETFIQSLQDLDADGFFGLGEARNQIVVLLTIGDGDQDTILRWAEQLNPPAAFQRFKESFSTHVGSYREIGSRKFDVMRSLSLSSNARHLAVGGWDHILAFALPDFEELLKKQVTKVQSAGVCCCVISPEGEQLFVGMNAGNRKGCIQRWSVGKGKKLSPEIPPLPGIVRTLAMSPDGRLITAGCEDDPTIRIWDSQTLDLLSQMTGHVAEVRCLRFSPSEGILASIEPAARSVRLWDVANARVLTQLDDNGVALAFSPDGKFLAVVSGMADDRVAVRLWDIAERRCVRTLDGPPGSRQTLSVSFSTNGKMLAVGGAFSGSAQLWEVGSGRELDRLDAGFDEVSDLAFLGGDETIAVVGKGMGVRRLPVTLWDISAAKRRCGK